MFQHALESLSAPRVHPALYVVQHATSESPSGSAKLPHGAFHRRWHPPDRLSPIRLGRAHRDAQSRYLIFEYLQHGKYLRRFSKRQYRRIDHLILRRMACCLVR
ncbi:Uncharacterised protein [Vibrio cholerae]|uniref:Uncharacterized protein n=1 Tax=Vibrio cholerae TaxID=666 RepID=A0A655QWU1_VIBCL|nr:Uncharacterised protein [Vibrio cholerae]CSA74945.1 Uncharacterised protein [Vibrio cholerae]